MFTCLRSMVILVMATASVVIFVRSDSPTKQKIENSLADQFSPKLIVAVCGETSFTAGDVEFQLLRTTGNGTLKGKALAVARAHALELLVNQALILPKLRSEKSWPGPSQVRLMVDKQFAIFKSANLKFEDFLNEKKISEDFWRLDLEWNLGWKNYLLQKFDQEALQAFYDARKRDFDGTQLLIAQILLADDGEQSVELARRLKDHIESGQITFGQAAKENSIAPSKEDEGRLGWISRFEPMPEGYSEAAFRLQQGEISPPVKTIYGVHLIKCLEVKVGKKMLGDAKEEVQKAAAAFEFSKLVSEVRPSIVVEFSVDYPHLGPDGQLILPQNSQPRNPVDDNR